MDPPKDLKTEDASDEDSDATRERRGGGSLEGRGRRGHGEGSGGVWETLSGADNISNMHPGNANRPNVSSAASSLVTPAVGAASAAAPTGTPATPTETPANPTGAAAPPTGPATANAGIGSSLDNYVAALIANNFANYSARENAMDLTSGTTRQRRTLPQTGGIARSNVAPNSYAVTVTIPDNREHDTPAVSAFSTVKGLEFVTIGCGAQSRALPTAVRYKEDHPPESLASTPSTAPIVCIVRSSNSTTTVASSAAATATTTTDSSASAPLKSLEVITNTNESNETSEPVDIENNQEALGQVAGSDLGNHEVIEMEVDNDVESSYEDTDSSYLLEDSDSPRSLIIDLDRVMTPTGDDDDGDDDE